MAPAEPTLDETGVADDPFAQFGEWFRAASDAGVAAPEAIAVATADAEARPAVRMVLLKSWDERGFVFFTNYDSRKGRELAANPRAALLAHWPPLGRQVRIEGAVARVSRGESDAYFQTRPVLSRLAAVASKQSAPIDSRAALEAAFAAARARFGDDPPLPNDWGGFRVEPDRFEFWQHRANRLHDRIAYVREGDVWVAERLQP